MKRSPSIRQRGGYFLAGCTVILVVLTVVAIFLGYFAYTLRRGVVFDTEQLRAMVGEISGSQVPEGYEVQVGFDGSLGKEAIRSVVIVPIEVIYRGEPLDPAKHTVLSLSTSPTLNESTMDEQVNSRKPPMPDGEGYDVEKSEMVVWPLGPNRTIDAQQRIWRQGQSATEIVDLRFKIGPVTYFQAYGPSAMLDRKAIESFLAGTHLARTEDKVKTDGSDEGDPQPEPSVDEPAAEPVDDGS